MLDDPAPVAVASPFRGLRFDALRIPTFRAYFAASTLSSAGDGMENVIRAWLVLQLAGEAAPFWLGMMVFAHWVPYTFFSLYGGVLADRYDNRKVQLASQALLLCAAVAVAYATLAGFVTVWWIFALLLLHGFAGAIGQPARQTLIHAMVGRENLVSAVSLNASVSQVAHVVGPVVAGFVLVAFGPGGGFLVNALTFIPLLVLLLVIRVPRLGAPAAKQPMRDSLGEGMAFVRARPSVAAFISVEMLSAVFLGQAFMSLLPVFATRSLGGDQLGYAFLVAAGGVGAVISGIYLATLTEVRHKGRLIFGAAMTSVVAIFLFALSTSYPASFALLVVVGGATVLTQSLTNTTIQLSAPDQLRGRVMGAYVFATQGLRVLNGPVLGGAAVLFGPPLAVAGSATLVLATLVTVLARVSSVRRTD